MLAYGAAHAPDVIHPCLCPRDNPHPSVYYCTRCWERFPVCRLVGQRRKCAVCEAQLAKED